MRNIKYTDSAQFRCLEHLRGTYMDLYLIHCGLEHCLPTHAIEHSIREEYIIHFVLEGKGSYTINGITYFLTASQMFLIRPGEEVRYAADPEDPWTYAWIGFDGIRAEAILKNCGFSKQSYVLPFKNRGEVEGQINAILSSVQLSFSNDLKRNSSFIQG